MRPTFPSRFPGSLAALLGILLLLGACGGGGGRDAQDPPAEDALDHAPAAQIHVTVRNGADTRWITAFSGTTSTVFQFFGQGADAQGGTLSYAWDFEFDGTFDAAPLEPTTNAQSPSHTFATPGDKVVALRVTGTSGSSLAFARLTIADAAITDAPPAVNLRAFTLLGATRFEVQFRAEARDPDGGALADLRWDFDGDGGEDTLDADGNATAGNDVPRHIYTTPGVFPATVTVTDDEGRTSEATVVIVVCEILPDRPPSAGILLLPPPGVASTEPMPLPVGPATSRIRVLALGSDLDGIAGAGCEVDWDLDMNGTFGDEDSLPASDVENNGRLLTLTLREGMQRIRVRVSDDDPIDPADPLSPSTIGESDIVLFGTGTEASTGPAVRVWAETVHMGTHPCVGAGDAFPKGIQFRAEAIDPDLGGTVSYEWTFGDEGLLDPGCVEGASVAEPIHAYATPGVYYATVTAIGSTAPATHRTTVVLPIVVATCHGPSGPGDICRHRCLPRRLSLVHGGAGPIDIVSCCTGALSIKSYEVLRVEGMAMGLSCGPFGVGVDLAGADITTMPARLDENPGTPPTATGAGPFPFLGCDLSSLVIQSGRIAPAPDCCVFPYRVLVRLRDPGKLVQIVPCHFDVLHGCARGSLTSSGAPTGSYIGDVQVEIAASNAKPAPPLHAFEFLFAEQNPAWTGADAGAATAPPGWEAMEITDLAGGPIGVRFVFNADLVGGGGPAPGPVQVLLPFTTAGTAPQQIQAHMFIPEPGLVEPLIPLGAVPLQVIAGP